MPVNLSIKDVPDDLAERLRQRAQRHHRSLQGELMAIVEQAASGVAPAPASAPAAVAMGRTPVKSWKTIDQLAQEARRRFPQGTPSSADLIRALRESRHGDVPPV